MCNEASDFMAACDGQLMTQFEVSQILADRDGITREDMDAFSAESHRRAHENWENGHFDAEVLEGLHSQIFDVAAGATLRLENVTVEGGLSGEDLQGNSSYAAIDRSSNGADGVNNGTNAGAYGVTFADLMGALAMLFGRFLPMVFVLALAGSLAKQQPIPESAGTLRTTSPLFVSMLSGVILIVVGLTYFPALALGPLAEGLH